MGTKATTKTTVDVLDLLQAQHEEVDLLIEQLEKGQGDRGALFMELADKLSAHATIEEKLFYPAIMAQETDELLHEAVEEHLEVKRLLADMMTMKLDDDDTFAAKLSVLKENLDHHAHEEEEGELFPMLRTSMSADERAGLGNECLSLFEQLLPQHPARNLAAETKAAAPLPSVA